MVCFGNKIEQQRVKRINSLPVNYTMQAGVNLLLIILNVDQTGITGADAIYWQQSYAVKWLHNAPIGANEVQPVRYICQPEFQKVSGGNWTWVIISSYIIVKKL